MLVGDWGSLLTFWPLWVLLALLLWKPGRWFVRMLVGLVLIMVGVAECL